MADEPNIRAMRPELFEISFAELERRKAEIEHALYERKKEEEDRKRAELREEASVRRERIIEDIKWWVDNGFASDKIRASFTTEAGVFAPHLSFKLPKV